MPLYEYECAKDGRFELIRKFSDPRLRKCPTCGQPVEKVASAPAFHLKGTGWYVTDYARKPEAKGNGTDADAKKNDEAKASDSSVSKDAKKNDEAKASDSSASKDAKTSTPSTSTSKEGSAPKGSSPTKAVS